MRGALSIALRARENGIKNLLIPEENAPEAAVVQGINVFPVRDLREAAEIGFSDLLSGKDTPIPPLKLDISEIRKTENQIPR